MTQLPPPHPSGYQPGPGEGYTEFAVEVRPSFGFQTAGVTGTYVFPAPRSFAEALPALEDIRAQLRDVAITEVNELVAARKAHEGGEKAAVQAQAFQSLAPAPAALAPQPAPAPSPAVDQVIAAAFPQATPAPAPAAAPAADGWAIGNKPKNSGTIRYLTTSAFPTDRLKAEATQQLAAAGIDPAQCVIYDDRYGNYGLESGNAQYAAGKVKAADGTVLAQLTNGRFVAYVDFQNDGSLKVGLSKDGQAAVAALRAMGNVQQAGAFPTAV